MFPRASLFVIVPMLALSACKKAAPDAETPKATAAAASPVDQATAATISGVVRFEGTPPVPQKINMAMDPNCSANHTEPIMATDVVINPDKSIKWVYVYVKSGLGDLKFPVPSEPAHLDQKGCLYQPHFLAVQAGQKIVVKNSDPVLHNVHAAPKINEGFNLGQPVQGMSNDVSFDKPEVAIPVKCDVHPWMLSWIAVQPHPFAAVTDGTGAFSLKGLPPGEYEIEAWHEKFGTSVQKVIVGAKEEKKIEFVFKG